MFFQVKMFEFIEFVEFIELRVPQFLTISLFYLQLILNHKIILKSKRNLVIIRVISWFNLK